MVSWSNCYYTRLTYSKLKKYDLAVECYEKALKLDATNEGYKKNLEIAREHMKEMVGTNYLFTHWKLKQLTIFCYYFRWTLLP